MKQPPLSNRRVRILLHTMGAIIGVVGFASVFGGDLIANKAPADVELPLSRFSSLLVDGEGRVHCVSDAYRRMQVYDAEGDFIRAYRLPSNVCEVYMDQEDNTYAWQGGRFGVYWKYDGSGSKTVDAKPPVSPDYYGRDIEEAVDSCGNTYRIASFSWVFPRVIKQTPSGERTKMISQPWRLWLIKSPVPAMPFVSLAVIYFLVHQRKRARRQKAVLLSEIHQQHPQFNRPYK